jgi:hypothetical protein
LSARFGPATASIAIHVSRCRPSVCRSRPRAPAAYPRVSCDPRRGLIQGMTWTGRRGQMLKERGKGRACNLEFQVSTSTANSLRTTWPSVCIQGLALVHTPFRHTSTASCSPSHPGQVMLATRDNASCAIACHNKLNSTVHDCERPVRIQLSGSIRAGICSRRSRRMSLLAKPLYCEGSLLCHPAEHLRT